MALINCPECAKEVSSSAPSCPNCGFAVSGESQAAGAALTTVQETSKRLKMHTLLSVALTAIGFVIWQNGPIGPGSLVFLAGLLWFFVTRFRIWWHHK